MKKKWFCEFDDRAKDFGIFDNSTQMLIATTRDGTDEDKYNAHLISKVPEIIEVLKGLVTDVDNLLGQHDIEWQQAGYFNEAKRLIKEATEWKN